VCERFFGRKFYFGKKNDNTNGDQLLTIISRVVLILIGIPIILLVIFEPAVLLIPAFLLLPFGAQAGVFFVPLFGWLTATLLLLFFLCYAITCHTMKKNDDGSGKNVYIEAYSWFSVVWLFYIHIFWIFYMKVFAIVLAIESFRPSPFFP
jgi:hypothetical protein